MTAVRHVFLVLCLVFAALAYADCPTCVNNENNPHLGQGQCVEMGGPYGTRSCIADPESPCPIPDFIDECRGGFEFNFEQASMIALHNARVSSGRAELPAPPFSGQLLIQRRQQTFFRTPRPQLARSLGPISRGCA